MKRHMESQRVWGGMCTCASSSWGVHKTLRIVDPSDASRLIKAKKFVVKPEKSLLTGRL